MTPADSTADPTADPSPEPSEPAARDAATANDPLEDAVLRAVRQVLAHRGDTARNDTARNDTAPNNAAPDQLSPDHRLADLGFDSLDLAEVIVLVEAEAGSEIRIHGGESLETLGDLARVARASTDRPATPERP